MGLFVFKKIYHVISSYFWSKSEFRIPKNQRHDDGQGSQTSRCSIEEQWNTLRQLNTSKTIDLVDISWIVHTREIIKINLSLFYCLKLTCNSPQIKKRLLRESTDGGGYGQYEGGGAHDGVDRDQARPEPGSPALTRQQRQETEQTNNQLKCKKDSLNCTRRNCLKVVPEVWTFPWWQDQARSEYCRNEALALIHLFARFSAGSCTPRLQRTRWRCRGWPGRGTWCGPASWPVACNMFPSGRPTCLDPSSIWSLQSSGMDAGWRSFLILHLSLLPLAKWRAHLSNFYSIWTSKSRRESRLKLREGIFVQLKIRSRSNISSRVKLPHHHLFSAF